MIETVTNDTKIPADIGMIMGVKEKNNVNFFTKKPISLEKYPQEEVEARVTEEAGAEPEVQKAREAEKEVSAEKPDKEVKAFTMKVILVVTLRFLTTMTMI